MSDVHDKEGLHTIQEEISDLVRRALIQAGDLQDIEGKMKIIVEKASKATPLPEAPPEENP